MDDLADLPPEEFVAARDALAKHLKAEGKVAQAAEVKKLRKPTVQAWIAGQVRRWRAEAVEGLRAATVLVAEAQEKAITGGDRDALRDATAQRRDAVRALGRAIDEVLADAGRPAHHRDEVLNTIEADITAEIASGTFGLGDDIDLPERSKHDPAKAKREEEAARKRKEEADAAIAAADARVERARRELDAAERELAAVLERHGGVERDA